ncbi:peptidase P60 [Brevundimonas sp.]|uniref:peptidase P60 n=1 Tax=Brevundimonas sp. TaxID=1871086 RepID=UPI00391E0324
MRTRALMEARGWIGTPYRHRASVRGEGCDCLGLVRGVWRGLHGNEPEALPPYSPDWAERGGDETLLKAARRWMVQIPVREARAGDVLLFRMSAGVPVKHCGIVGSGSVRPTDPLHPAAQGPPPPRGEEMTLIHAYWGRAVIESWMGDWWTRRVAAAFVWPETGEGNVGRTGPLHHASHGPPPPVGED